jgi:L-serine deaminase
MKGRLKERSRSCQACWSVMKACTTRPLKASGSKLGSAALPSDAKVARSRLSTWTMVPFGCERSRP